MLRLLAERLCFEHSSARKGSARRFRRLRRLWEKVTGTSFIPRPAAHHKEP